MKSMLYCWAACSAWLVIGTGPAGAQTLEEQLRAKGTQLLAGAARAGGDARRGAVVFHQAQLACTRCHVADKAENPLGPDLTRLGRETSDAHLIESLLEPSRAIRPGFEPVTLTARGETIRGILVSDDGREVVMRDDEQNFKEVRFPRSDVSRLTKGSTSIMPPGLANALNSEQQFLDLVRYLMEIRDGGAARARELEPDPSLYAERPLPDYEHQLDHAGLIRGLDEGAFERGQQIYNNLCVNCHGAHDLPGSLPTSLRFAHDRFKNGNDPFSMYQTLTRGFGMMAAQTWMVPSEKYDVIHYIREAYLKERNPSQYSRIDDAYLARLPQGTGKGPAPSKITPWRQMDYGPNLVMTLEVGEDAGNFAYKGNAIRLDAGPGGVSQGRYWMVFDYDTLRVAAAWSGDQFCDWNGINFNGRHAIHPRVVGRVDLANPAGPGWGRPGDGSFKDLRLVGRDDRIYGPLPRDWAHYKGMYYHGPRTLIDYTVGEARILEMPGVLATTPEPVFTRQFRIGPRDRELLLQVAHRDGPGMELKKSDGTAVFGAGGAQEPPEAAPSGAALEFDGTTRLEPANPEKINLHQADFTLRARVRTRADGTLLARTQADSKWVPNGMTWFVSGGRLMFDIGWVGAVRGQRQINDGKWHDLAMTYEHESGRIQFYVDGTKDGNGGTLKPKEPVSNPVVRIGYTSENFPGTSAFTGEIAEVWVHDVLLSAAAIRDPGSQAGGLAAHWNMKEIKAGAVQDLSGRNHHARIVRGPAAVSPGKPQGWTVAGVEGRSGNATFEADGGNLRLRIPAGQETLRFTLWFASVDQAGEIEALIRSVVLDDPAGDLSAYTRGGPPRWSQILTSDVILGEDDGPFAVDVMKLPADNPWFCRMRLSGFDFTDDGDAAIVSAWDGSVWKVSGLGELPERKEGRETVPITWRRIASGLFQPLGVKIVGGKIYVTCRDQLAILHDLNGDEEIDYIESFNNDHQVTDHFHEFAMGLQADREGNFYYAKSARHAMTALVPHHGTLLRVSKDGLRTDILATGFRAANGVCLNPDGTFIVTDQEGHWNPKNRINYVRAGGFYGNMFGYHDVTDASDDAMEQPLCWITNDHDRSPAELLWVESSRWGPLNGKLLNLSYGFGKVYIVPHETIDGQAQGGMVAFPIDRFPTGIMRGRFHPADGQLYLAGMFAWAGNQTADGGFYRLRYTGNPVHLPVELKAAKRGMTIGFSGPLNREAATDAGNYQVKVWDLKRTANYGSKHYNEQPLPVTAARLDADGRTVRLEIPGIAPTWSMEIRYQLRAEDGRTVEGTLHNTIHKLGN